jgi:hypothetical protein
MVSAIENTRPLVIEEAGPIPSSRALAPLAVVPLKRIEAAPTLEDYAALAAELGFEPEDLEDLRLQHFLAANGVRVFDYEAVCRWMDELVTPTGARWFWSPLRPKDGECHHMDGYLRDVRSRGGVRHGYTWLDRPYTQTVPFHILNRVRLIERGFTGRAFFFVSDYAVSFPDPFLMVRVSGGPPYVIGQWDAPCWLDHNRDDTRPAPQTAGSAPKKRPVPLRRIAFAAGLVVSALFLAWRHSGTHNPHPIVRAK